MLQGIKREGSDPVKCGGFADIHRGMYGQDPVALKRLRVFLTIEDSKKANLRKVLLLCKRFTSLVIH